MNCTCVGECQVPAWSADGSWYANNPGRFAHAITLAHRWFAPERLAEVEQVRAEIRAMPPATTFACVGCGRYAFAEPNVTCFWCKRRQVAS